VFISCNFVKNVKMSTVTVRITTRSKKAKYLLGLIEELSKSDKGIKICEPGTPNSSTLKAMDDAEKGLVKKAKSVDELFDLISSKKTVILVRAGSHSDLFE
jgi:hypothetical protein